ncbi:PBECR4 domain-containing protein [Streptococcus mitis]|uniref:PBECR4 domain-containing protein n=3 Tax=Streptococcus TaxID=1301 RepID=UPI001BE4602A|nr:PBECR4 domain-containing protein [Streptococcus mitis]MBT2165425.1 hypothetical protein [Streptococcus mitis]
MEQTLIEAIRSYSILENTTYKMELTQKSNPTPIILEIKFNTEFFFHLFGFHYLENLDKNVIKQTLFKNLRTLVYRNTPLSQSKYYNQITTSPSFQTPTIQNRLNIIKDLPYLLDRFSKKNDYWKYIEPNGISTNIKWDYLIILSSDENITNQEKLLFLRKEENNNYLIPISTFSQEPRTQDYLDYKKGQSRYDISSLIKTCL